MITDWNAAGQFLALWQSLGLGVWMGALFCLESVLVKKCRRWVTLAADALFGVFAAVFTLFGALAITDGKLLPLLFAGEAVGFLSACFGVRRAAVFWRAFRKKHPGNRGLDKGTGRDGSQNREKGRKNAKKP